MGALSASLQAVNHRWQWIRTVMKVVFRHPIVGTTIIPILPDGRIVLVRRRDRDFWAIPGGLVDWGEDMPTTVRRELAEETGLDLVKVERLIGVYSDPERARRIHAISILVVASVRGEIAVQDTREIGEARAFALDEIPRDNLACDHGRQLQDFLDGATFVR
ncbi:MAG: NUDIX hydrolase [Cyanobacteria bacterium P01_D01_bin.123]